MIAHLLLDLRRRLLLLYHLDHRLYLYQPDHPVVYLLDPVLVSLRVHLFNTVLAHMVTAPLLPHLRVHVLTLQWQTFHPSYLVAGSIRRLQAFQLM